MGGSSATVHGGVGSQTTLLELLELLEPVLASNASVRAVLSFLYCSSCVFMAVNSAWSCVW
jgi:hypothetical protein